MGHLKSLKGLVLSLVCLHCLHPYVFIMFSMCHCLRSMYVNNVLDWIVIQVETEGGFQVRLVCILDHKIKQLWN